MTALDKINSLLLKIENLPYIRGNDATDPELVGVIENVINFLSCNDVPITYTGHWKNLREWAAHKGELLRLFATHPLFDAGDLCIKTTVTYTAVPDLSIARRYINTLLSSFGPNTSAAGYECLGYLERYLSNDRLDATVADFINGCALEDSHGNVLRTKAGARVGRVVRKIMEFSGVYVDKDIENIISELSASLQEKTETAPLYISLHIIDYLLMSYGTRWSSCHTLNEALAGGKAQGKWRRGPVSYMNDGCTIVAYIPSTSEGEIYPRRRSRNLFHVSLKNKAIIQGRLYPDGSLSPLFPAIREAVIQELCKITGWDRKSEEKVENSFFGFRQGDTSHFPDYKKLETASGLPVGENITYFGGEPPCETEPIGSETFCFECGCSMRGCEPDTLICGDCQWGANDSEDDDDIDNDYEPDDGEDEADA